MSAFGLLTVDVKNDYVQTHVSLQDDLDEAAVQQVFDDLSERAARALTKEGFAPEQHRFAAHRRPALLRPGLRGAGGAARRPTGPTRSTRLIRRWPRRFHAEHKALYGYDFSTDPRQQVEWVNLRVSGVGPIRRPRSGRTPSPPSPATPEPRAPAAGLLRAADGYVDTPVHWRPDLAPGHSIDGPAIIEEFGSTVPLHPGFTARIDEYRNIIVTREGA